MARHTALMLIAIVLAAHGSYYAVHAIAMLPGPTSLLLLLAFAIQAVLAILATFGVWRDQRWAAAALLLLGVSIAATVLVEAIVLGIRPWPYALPIAIAAIAIALALGSYLDRSGSLLDGRGDSRRPTP